MKEKIGEFLLWVLILSLRSQEVSHFHEELIGGYRPLNSTVIMNSIVDAARQYEGNDVPRFAQYDYAFPRDSSEYSNLSGNSVLLIIGFTHDSTELPFSKVYLKSFGKEINLVKLMDTKLIYSNEKVLNLFGQHSIVSLYLLPLQSLTNQPELRLDWKRNRKGFSFGKLDAANNLGFKISKLAKTDIDEAYLKAFLLREFPLIAN